MTFRQLAKISSGGLFAIILLYRTMPFSTLICSWMKTHSLSRPSFKHTGIGSDSLMMSQRLMLPGDGTSIMTVWSMTLASHLHSLCEDLMIGTFAPHFQCSFCPGCWQYSLYQGFNHEWLACEVSSFQRDWSEYPSVSWPFAMPLGKARPSLANTPAYSNLYPYNPYDKLGTHSFWDNTCQFLCLWCGNFRHRVDHLWQPIQANPHAPLSQGGRIISSYWSKPESRSVSLSMSMHHAAIEATHCMASTSAPLCRPQACCHRLHQKLTYPRSCTKS